MYNGLGIALFINSAMLVSFITLIISFGKIKSV